MNKRISVRAIETTVQVKIKFRLKFPMSPNPNSIHELGLGDKEKLSINLGLKI